MAPKKSSSARLPNSTVHGCYDCSSWGDDLKFGQALAIVAIFIQAVGQNMQGADTTPAANEHALAGHGTLVVALATPKFIVVATDSRRTAVRNGQYSDNSKKLFRVGKSRVLAIAGLADITLPQAAGLSEQVAPFLDQEIARTYEWASGIEDRYWNDPPPPDLANVDERFRDIMRKHENDIPYFWWIGLSGPTQTIFSVLETYVPGHDLFEYRLEGLLAGFKKNEEAKIERFGIVPQRGLSHHGRPEIGIAQWRAKFNTSRELISKTMGMTALADAVLEGEITPNLIQIAAKYPAIKAYLSRRQQGVVDKISESEAVSLSKDLIEATADLESTVGRRPIQLAVLRPNGELTVDQPTFPAPGIFLPANGTWMMGKVFTTDDPFDQWKRDVVYTSCEISNNRTPIPLGDNLFFGNVFDHATFIYSGGRIMFGNNVVRQGKLLIKKGVDESPLAEILSLFATVERVE
jgi:hypothetical protein